MVKISFNGGCKEIGRSAILIESEITTDRILLDYGVKMSGKEENFPEHVSGRDLTAIVITHSHIDHVGGIPIFYISGRVPAYMTELTFEVSLVLLRDMININRKNREFFLPFDKKVIERMKQYTHFLNYNKRTKIGENSYITLHSNGHIPGSASVLLEMDDKVIYYSGDLNASTTQLLNGGTPPSEKIDALIFESTYGTTDHEPRKEIEKTFITEVKRILDQGGRVLIPAFGVSRSQEMLMVLNEYGIMKDHQVTLDGMARKVFRLYENYPKFFRNFDKFLEAGTKTHFVNQKQRFVDRETAKKQPGVIVAPSGMLKGGTARMYAEAILEDPKSAIFLVSFQIPESPGAILVAENKYLVDVKDEEQKEKVDVKCEVKSFSFSSHSGKNEMIEFMNKISFKGSEKKVFLVHGDEEISVEFAKTLNENGFKANAVEQCQTDII